MNKRSKWFVTLVALSLLTATVLTFSTRVSSPEEDDIKPASSLTEIATTPAPPAHDELRFEDWSQQSRDRQSEMNSSYQALNQAFFDAENAHDAAQAIKNLRDAGYEEQSRLLKHQLDNLCPPNDLQPPVVVAEQQWVIGWIDRFCGSYRSSDNDLIESLAWQQHEIETRAQNLLNRMTGRNLQQQSEFLLTQIQQATSWLDLEALKLAIFTSFGQARATDRWSDIWVHALGQDLQYQGDLARDIQTTALTLLQCIDFVDCGANSPFTISQCYTQPFCEPGWSLYDFLYNTHSPLETAQIFQLLELFLNMRRVPNPP